MNGSESSILQTLAAKLDRDPGTPVQNATESFWQDPPHSFASQQSATLPTESDVVIIGSGISAISTALHLLREDASLKIVLLEARTAISGATGRNGGHIKAVPWSDYSALKEEFGKESAIKITKFRLAHLDVMVDEAAALGEGGKVGLVRRVEGVSAVYDREAWESAKVRLETFLEDFPEERGQWTACEEEADLLVRAIYSIEPLWGRPDTC
jgi:glycine/D-amino acid oxidase-like deaminating enzyme